MNNQDKPHEAGHSGMPADGASSKGAAEAPVESIAQMEAAMKELESQKADLTDRLLRRRDDVVAFASARPAQGGTGAVVVLLKA